MRKKLFIGAAGTLVIFFIIELITRLSGFSPVIRHTKYMVFTTDENFFIKDGIILKDHFLFARNPYLFWRLKYPTDSFHFTNLQGFRGRLISKKKSNNIVRIFCIGDSCTFGLGVKYFEAYPFILEELLNKNSSKIKYEVVNAGVPGYSSLQGLRLLERYILGYKPDIIIASFGWNDTHEALYYTDKQQRLPGEILLSVYDVLKNSKAYLLLEDIILNLKFKLNAHDTKMLKREGCLLRVPEDDFVENLTAINKLGRLHKFKVMFLNQPCRLLEPHRYDIFIKKVSREVNVPFLDLQDKLAISKIAVKDIFIDLQHPTVAAHRIIAEAVYNFLEKEGMCENKTYSKYKSVSDM
jgi:lysophospholipase L1-like esterase